MHIFKHAIRVIIIVLIAMNISNAQDEGAFTHYLINTSLVNPAYTGFNDQHEIFANYRNRWSEFDGSPNYYTLNYSGAVNERVGIGALLAGQSFGAVNRVRGQLSYAYRFGNEDWKMSIGLATEFEQFKIDGNVTADGLVDPNDPLLRDAIDGTQFFDLNAGFYGEYQETFFVGLSAPDMIRARIDDVQLADDENEPFLQYFTALVGYRFDIASADMKFEPSVFMRRLRNLDFQVDINARFTFLSDQLTAGLTYTVGSGDRLGFLLGTQFETFRFYYAYDASFAQLQDYANGSHEITVGVSWPRRVSE